MSAEPHPQETGPFEARPSVVFADDDEFVRCLLGIQLQHAFDFTGMASNADDAIELVRAKRPDVAILDVNMPGGGARRATDEIRRCSPETAIVILSGDETHETVVELLLRGADAYLRKGIDGATLATQLMFAIEAHRHRRAAEAVLRAAAQPVSANLRQMRQMRLRSLDSGTPPSPGKRRASGRSVLVSVQGERHNPGSMEDDREPVTKRVRIRRSAGEA